MDDRIQDTLSFWFGEPEETAAYFKTRQRLWFRKSAETDAAIGAQFGDTLIAAAAGRCDDWATTLRGRLALIVVLDQFSRNLRRGQPAMFAQDAKALALALEAIDADQERSLPLAMRMFFYMPLEHAENEALQDRCVALFTQLWDDAPEPARPLVADFKRYAEMHRDVIRRFGRFPHRNAILGRQDTAEERAFLTQPGSRF